MWRKILGWVLLVLGALAAVFLLTVALVGVFTPSESVGVTIAAVMVTLLMALTALGMAFLGVYLIWLRGRRRPQST